MRLLPSLALAALICAPAFADGPENALFVQSVQSWQSAEDSADPASRLDALRAAETAIAALLSDHAATDLAVAVVLDQSDLPFTRAGLRAAIAEAEAEIAARASAAEANALLVSAIQAMEQGAAMEPTDRDSALMRYAHLRGAQLQAERLQADYADSDAARNAARSRPLRGLNTEVEAAAADVAGFCEGSIPQDCMLQEATELAQGNNFHLARIAYALAQTGAFTKAEKILHYITAPERNEYATKEILRNTIEPYAEADDLTTTNRLSEYFQDPIDRVKLLNTLGLVYAKTGKLTRSTQNFLLAEQTARGIEHDYDRAGAFSDIAAAYAKAGQFAKAEQIARDIEHDDDPAGAFSDIAAAYAEAGQFAQAEQTARGIEHGYTRAWAFSGIARAYAEAGQFAKAEQTAQGIAYDGPRAWAFRGIARAYAEAGQFDKAEQTARGMEYDSVRAGAFSDIAGIMAKQGDLSGALAAVALIDDPREKAVALARVALHF